MTDSTINRFLSEGTAAQRTAFTPVPPTPASGPAHGYFWYETDTGKVYAWDVGAAAWKLAAGGGPTAPTVRSSNITSSSASNYTLTFPAGAVAGDVVVVFGGHGFAINVPAGWTQIDRTSAANWNGMVCAKQLTSADISIGSVTVTTGGAFNGVFALLCFVGQPSDTHEFKSQQNSGSTTSDTLITSWVPLTSDIAVVFGSARNAISPTSSYGTQLQQINAAAASGVLAAATVPASGSVTTTVTYPTGSSSGDYTALLVMRGR